MLIINYLIQTLIYEPVRKCTPVSGFDTVVVSN